ncbi:MAG: pantetheine-phosphate adenylyltransferase [Erysipelotrichaceae bacterium]|nr:pantetheine-phosphate adenylyltransferase [Erysipelotrichaceae bacterium]MBR5048886.1 pantetheine-phosphate adenylyltransferase [Erysipelotrichaceae bacterium]
MIAIYPGSFDPITYGHMDIIERAAALVDKLIIVIMANDEKSGTFSFAERKEMIEQAVTHLDNVSVVIGEGLTAEFAGKVGAGVIIRGIRAVSDYEYEMQLATANMTIAPEVETVFILAKPQYSFLSSSTAKTIAANNGPLESFVDDYVAARLREKYRK